jgi:hypothetical protein
MSQMRDIDDCRVPSSESHPPSGEPSHHVGMSMLRCKMALQFGYQETFDKHGSVDNKNLIGYD